MIITCKVDIFTATFKKILFESFKHNIIMGILSWLLFGLIAGAIAKLLHKGDDPGGWIVTILIGIVGAFVGGAIARFLLGWGDGMGFNFKSFLSAVGGAIIVLAVYRSLAKNKS